MRSEVNAYSKTSPAPAPATQDVSLPVLTAGRPFVAAVMIGISLVSGCAPEKPNASAPEQPTQSVAQLPPQPASYAMTNAQPKLPTVKLWLGSKEIVAEIASTTVQISTGMMFRKEMPENDGMLFVFLRPHRTTFYMRNTYIPLSCAYIDPEGTILEIHDMKPLDESPILAKTDDIQYVLEMNQGWFQRNDIQVGTVVRTEAGSLRDTFFRRTRP
jgi:uncharacterized membrane protein (UPF0127 family)